MICIGEHCYELVENNKGAFDEEQLKSRYSEILHKYDYLVGDIGYEQLRLRGFFDDGHDKATYDTKISTLPEYIYEYCNFGCPYFVLKKITPGK
ncbi:Uncharacterized protein YutD [Fictibacillus enclensis]|uniref:Transcriptional regulator n=1 Tax=Fictibacillus enclensis TaxID=1017270 RepID=A0A0V8J8P0_9BACL|nr:YutD family protein [Fictibacillus enclensis]KSU83389.1 hypothetical protein AS030_12540 [Fictibacillus enclensis]SCC14749.1 Uncharacterized protein YutD [Fictibacillus enclensis]